MPKKHFMWRVLGGLGALALVTAMAACTHDSNQANHHKANHSPGKSATTPASSGSSSGSTCRAKDVDLALGRVDSGAGQRSAPLRITAHDGVSCTMNGYPSELVFLAKDGSPMPTQPTQFADSPIETVTVRPDHPAHISLHWVGIPAGDDSADQSAPYLLKLKLPGAADSSTVRWSGGQAFQNGSLEYKAVAAGSDES